MNCIRNYPWYRGWYDSFAKSGLTIIGIHTPEGAHEHNVDTVKEKAAEAKFAFPILIDNDRRNWNAWGNSMWPTVYLIDKRGYVRYWWLGELNWEGAEGEQLFRRHIEESLELARRARESATAELDEADRFVTDSQALVYITQAWRHKVLAAIEKRLLAAQDSAARRTAFLHHLEDSVRVYEQLVALTDQHYVNATDMLMRLNWHNGLQSFRDDVAQQTQFVQLLDDRRKLGPCWVETEDMEGNWKLGTNYLGYSDRGFRVSDGPLQRGTVLRTKVVIERPGTYTVWARGLLAGTTDRSFAVEVGGKKFPATHAETGPPRGEFVWRKAGELKFGPGPVEIVIHDAGPGYECPDVIVLAEDPNWKPR